MLISDWTDALRSGKYPQGIHMLYDARCGEFDPIGVACDLINPAFKNRNPEFLDCIDFVVPVSGELAHLMKACPLMVSYVQMLNSMEVPFRKIADEIDDINLYWGESELYAHYCDKDGPELINWIVTEVQERIL